MAPRKNFRQRLDALGHGKFLEPIVRQKRAGVAQRVAAAEHDDPRARHQRATEQRLIASGWMRDVEEHGDSACPPDGIDVGFAVAEKRRAVSDEFHGSTNQRRQERVRRNDGNRVSAPVWFHVTCAISLSGSWASDKRAAGFAVQNSG